MSKSKIKQILLNSSTILVTATPIVLTCCNNKSSTNQDDSTRTITLNGSETKNSDVYVNDADTLRNILSNIDDLADSDLEYVMTNYNDMFTIEYNKYGSNSITFTATDDAVFLSEDEKYTSIKGEYTVNYNYTEKIKIFSMTEVDVCSFDMLSFFSDFFNGIDSTLVTSCKVDINPDTSKDTETTEFEVAPISQFVYEFTAHGDQCIGKSLSFKTTFTFSTGQEITLDTPDSIWVGVPLVSPMNFFTSDLSVSGVTIDISTDTGCDFAYIKSKLLEFVDTRYAAKFDITPEQVVDLLFPVSSSYFTENNTYDTGNYDNGFLLYGGSVYGITYIGTNGYEYAVSIDQEKSTGILIKISLSDNIEYSSVTSGINVDDPSSLSQYTTSLSINDDLTTPTFDMYKCFYFLSELSSNSVQSSINLLSRSIYDDITSYPSIDDSVSSTQPMVVDNSTPSVMHFTSSAIPRQVNVVNMEYENLKFSSSSVLAKNFPYTLNVTPDFSTNSTTSSITVAATSSESNVNTMSVSSTNSLLVSKKINDSTALTQTLHLPTMSTGFTNSTGLSYTSSGATPTVTKNSYSSKTWLFDNTRNLYSGRALDISNDLSYTNDFQFSTTISSVNISATIGNPAALSFYFTVKGKDSVSLRELYNINTLAVGAPSIHINGLYNANYSLINSYNNTTIFNKQLANNNTYDVTFQDINAVSDISVPLTTNVGATSVNSTVTTAIPTSTLNYISFPDNNVTSIQNPTESAVLWEVGATSDDGAYRTANVQNRTYGNWKWLGVDTDIGNYATSDALLNDLKSSYSTYNRYSTKAVRAGFANTSKYNLGLNNKPSAINLSTKVNLNTSNYGQMQIHFEDNNGVHYSLYDAVNVSIGSNGKPVFSLNSNFKLCFDVKFYNPIREVGLNVTYPNWTIANFARLTSITDWYNNYISTSTAIAKVLPGSQTLADFCANNWSAISNLISSSSKTATNTIYVSDGTETFDVAVQNLEWKNIFNI